jgi:hypothetical protein
VTTLKTETQEEMVRYLLGELTEAESARLEDSSFANPEQLAELRSVENDLIDEYARGEMRPVAMRNFEKLFMADPDRRKRVSFALALANVTSRRSVASNVANDVASNRNWLNSFASLFRFSNPGWVYAAGLVTVAVLIGGWWFVLRTNSIDQSAQIAQAPAPGPSQTVALASPSAETTNNQPDNPPSKPSLNKPESAPRNTNDRVPSQTSVATFVLLPGLSRSENEATSLIIPRGKEWLRLKVKLEEHDAVSYQNFTAELKLTNGLRVWTSRPLTPGNRTLTLNLPLSTLPAPTGSYELTLRGHSPQQRNFEPIGYYYLNIVKE